MAFSSANSINWGRLVPQIVYYFSAYCDMIRNGRIKAGDKINFVVPTWKLRQYPRRLLCARDGSAG